MKKVLLTATVQSHIGQFHRPLAEVLHENGAIVHVAAKDNLAEKNGLTIDFVDRIFDIPFARSPKSPDNLRAYFKLKKLLSEEHYDVVHCNTPMGSIVTRLAAIGTRKKGTRIIYTAHGFHFCKGAPKKNWLVFYPIERFMARFCDTLITITKEDYSLAKPNFACETEHIHGVGVYTDRYHPVSAAMNIVMREAEGLAPDDFVILCTGELNDNKNQKLLIEAAGLLKPQISGLKILLAGNGPKEAELKQQIQGLGLEKTVTLMGYRTDLERITPAVDLVVSCSKREGLPLNILEAMLCEKPVVTSFNRGHNELVKDNYNGFKVKADAESYAKAILTIYKNPELAERFGRNGRKKAEQYTAESVKKELKKIYGL